MGGCRYFPASQLLILEDTDLKKNARATMMKAFKFVGLPTIDLPQEIHPSQVEKLIKKQWPKFEDDTGWQFNSQYSAPIPADLRKEMAEFYAPHNARLEQFLGRTFNWR